MENIFSRLNKQQSLSSMRCLADIVSDKKRKESESKGYFFGYTAKSWSKLFHGINPRYVYCTKADALPSELYYLDKERYICFPMQIYNGQILDLTNSYQDTLRKMIQEKRAQYDARDYLRLLGPITSEQTGNIAMGVLRLMLENEEPNPSLYKAAIDTYSFCDCGAQELGVDALERLFLCKSDEQKAKTAAALANYPEKITVYRGEGSESTPYTEAYTWTTYIDTAYFFAGRRSSTGCKLCEGTVLREDVLEYIADRNETEIIVAPDKVSNVHVLPLFGLDEMLALTKPTMFDRKRQFPSISFPANILSDTKALYETIHVEDHSVDHPLRVALLASFLYRCEVLMPLLDKSNASYQDALPTYEALIAAAEYHDSGRWDNAPNDTHGAAGYARYQQDHGNNEVVNFLCTFHCKADEDARAYWQAHFDGEDKELVWTAFEIMKDADALDRVRFGRHCEDYLKVSFLHSDTSRKLVPAAMQLALSALF